MVERNGIRLRVTEAGVGGPTPGRVVVLAHGFPELAFSWRHQIPALAAAGYHVLAPDQRGYGGSSRPEAVEDYDIHALSADLVALLDDVGADRGVFVGHDWGASVVWNTAQLHPDRVLAVAGLSVPPIPRPRMPPTEAFRKFGDDFYILRYQKPGPADAELGADPLATMRTLFAGDAHAPLPNWIGADELRHYADEFTSTGFTGGLNWYRNFDRNWESTAHPPAPTIDDPRVVHRWPRGSLSAILPYGSGTRGGQRALPRGMARRRRALVAAGQRPGGERNSAGFPGRVALVAGPGLRARSHRRDRRLAGGHSDFSCTMSISTTCWRSTATGRPLGPNPRRTCGRDH